MTETIRLSFPATADHLALARQAAAVAAARCGFTVERIDDARLLIDEAVAVLIAARAERIDAELHSTSDGIDITVVAARAVLGAEAEMAWTVMRALADAVDVTRTQDGVRIAIGMRTLDG